MTRIAVDAMGGDRAPEEIVLGALQAARTGASVILVGDEARISPILAEERSDVDAGSIEVVHASEVIDMHDDAGRAIREKKDASVSVAARLVADGRAEGLVSAGSTGAAMAAAAFIIGRLPHVSRPAVASIFPTGRIVLDSGANLSCRAEHLVQFAVMGAALATAHHGMASPRVGLLNIGEEEGKGRDVEREAHGLLTAFPGINFVGNVEGRDLATDRCDVIVTDGFTGNVLVKTAEGTATFLQELIFGTLSAESDPDVLAGLLPTLGAIRHRIDPERVGGAHLLGTNGVVVIAHGSSSRKAIAGAIGLAVEGCESGLAAAIERGLATNDGGS